MKVTAKDWHVIHDYAEMYGLIPQLSTPSAGQYRFTNRNSGLEVNVSLQAMTEEVAAAKKRDKEQ